MFEANRNVNGFLCAVYCCCNKPSCSSSADISVFHLSPLSFVGGFETAESDLIPRFHLGKVFIPHKVLLKEHSQCEFGERNKEQKNPGFSFSHVHLFFT